MTASPAELQRIGTEMSGKITEADQKIGSIGGVVTTALSSTVVQILLTPPVVTWLVDAVNWLVNALSTALQKIWEFLQGIAAPVTFLVDAFTWGDVQIEAARIAEAVNPGSNTDMKVGTIWKGPAADAYARSIKPQTEKAAKISSGAKAVAISLGVCGAAGLAFYIALGVIIVRLIIGAAAVIAAFGTVALAPAGVALAIEEAAVNSGMIIAAVSTLTACLGAQAQQANSIRSDIMSSFPEGKWPDPTVAGFSDASMSDGDGSDWRLRP